MYKTEEEKQALHTQLVKWLADCEEAETIWADEAEEDYKFYAGEQDTVEVRLELERQNRPNTVYNEVKPKIDMLVGMAAQMDGAITIMPRTLEDAPLVELMTGAVDFYREKTRMKRKENSCFEHAVKCGKSWLHFYVDETDKVTPIKCQRVPARDVHCDPDSIEYDKSDARFLFRDKWYTADDIEAAWPQFKFPRDAAGNVVQATFASLGRSNYTPDFFNRANDKYRVVECWWKRYETKHVVLNPLNGNKEELTEEEFKEFKARLKKGISLPNNQTLQQDTFESVPIVTQVLYTGVITGIGVIEVGRSTYKHGLIPYVYLEAYHDEENNRPLSVIQSMKDPQRGLNTTRRQLVHLLQTSPKGILIHETGAILNIEDYEENSSKAGFHLEVAKGGLDKIKFSNQPQISNIYAQLDGLFQQSMKDSSGIQDSLMGIQTATREPVGTARMRTDSSVAVLYILFENYKEFKYQCMKILVSNIQQFVTDAQIIRIQGEGGYRLMEINSQVNKQAEGWNDIGSAQFDLIYDEDIVTKSTRLAVAEILADFNRNNPGSIPSDLMLEYANIPYTAQVKVRQAAAAASESAAKEAQLSHKELAKELELKEREVVVKEKELDFQIRSGNKEKQTQEK